MCIRKVPDQHTQDREMAGILQIEGLLYFKVFRRDLENASRLSGSSFFSTLSVFGSSA